MKILIMRGSALGDVILATAVVNSIQANYPDAIIDFATSTAMMPLLRNHPNIRRVLAIGTPPCERYQHIIDLQNKARTFWYGTKNPGKLHRYVKRSFWGLLQEGIKRKPSWHQGHQLHSYFQFLENIGLPCVVQQSPSLHFETTTQNHHELIAQGDIAKQRNRIIIAPNTTSTLKMWPTESFKKLVFKLSAHYDCYVTGGLPDTQFVTDFAKQTGAKLFAQPIASTFEELANQFATAELVVSHDSGLGHFANALAIPSLSIFGPTDPERWKPPLAKAQHIHLHTASSHSLDCHPCSNHGEGRCKLSVRRCMTELTVDHVHSKIEQILSTSN